MATQATQNRVRKTAKRQLAQPVGRTFRDLSQEELIADMRRYGREVSRSKEAAIAFLQAAGIADEHGNLAEMYRV